MAHIEFFRKSGKPTVAYVERGSEMEYMLASACEEIYVPPLGLLLLFGHNVQGVFVRGTLDKLGMEPTVRFQCCYLERWRCLCTSTAIVWYDRDVQSSDMLMGLVTCMAQHPPQRTNACEADASGREYEFVSRCEGSCE